jgi:hypothetical protein
MDWLITQRDWLEPICTFIYFNKFAVIAIVYAAVSAFMGIGSLPMMISEVYDYRKEKK